MLLQYIAQKKKNSKKNKPSTFSGLALTYGVANRTRINVYRLLTGQLDRRRTSHNKSLTGSLRCVSANYSRRERLTGHVKRGIHASDESQCVELEDSTIEGS